jgi:hypothetical protein
MKRTLLRIEKSKQCSGVLLSTADIIKLKSEHYLVKPYKLDGDAPKQFIKAYFFKRDSVVKKAHTTSWKSYIAKTAEKWYPVESVVEYMINRIGQELGLHMNNIKLVMANKQIRFLSEYFLNKEQKLIHGAEICGEHLGDMDLAAEIANNKIHSRQLFTFEFIRDAIRSVFPKNFEEITHQLVKLIVFDAIVGNNDRHFYNWGVIDTKQKTAKLPNFAPIYDSARGLLWNSNDEKCRVLYNNYLKDKQKILNYLNGACPRISIENNTQANHFELVDFLLRFNKEFSEIVARMTSIEMQTRVFKMLKAEFFDLFIEERYNLVVILLTERFKKLRGLTNAT